MNSRKGPSIYIRLKSKNLKLIFKGFKILNEDFKRNIKNKNNWAHSMSKQGIEVGHKPHRYNKNKPIIILLSVVYIFFYIKHNFFKFEFQKIKNPNFLIPKIVYRIRREHYVYWEKSRLARGLSTTFSYYNYDKESKMINITSRKGEVEVKKLLFKPGQESKEVLENPLLEKIYKKKRFSEYKANKILLYYINIDNRFDLDNYLQYKMITPLDFIRVIYYKFMLITGIADKYRNEQYIAKFDIFYEIERLLLVANLNSLNRQKVRDDLAFLFIYFIVRLNFDIKEGINTFKKDLFS